MREGKEEKREIEREGEWGKGGGTDCKERRVNREP